MLKSQLHHVDKPWFTLCLGSVEKYDGNAGFTTRGARDGNIGSAPDNIWQISQMNITQKSLDKFKIKTFSLIFEFVKFNWIYWQEGGI